MRSKKWTLEEIKLLKDSYLDESDRNIANILNRTIISVSVKRRRMRLIYPNIHPNKVLILPIESRPLCACGCGMKTSGRWYNQTKRYAKFVFGHSCKTLENREIVRKTARKRFTGKKFTDEHKKNLGKSISLTRKELFKKGILKVHNKGIPRPDWIKKANAKISKDLWQDEGYKKKWLEGMKNKVMVLPSSLELKFLEIIKKYSLPYKYVGNGYTFIGGKCPDFIDFKAKVIIEINGRYYHKNDKENERENHFSKYGYKTIIIWEEDLKDENKVLEKIKNLMSYN